MAPAKKPWFRFYVEALTDKKLRRQKVETRWLFVACLAASRESCLPGWLMVSERVPMTLDDLADYASLPPRTVTASIKALEEVGVVEFDENVGAWHVTRWNERQYESDTSTDRTAKHRSNGVPSTADTPSHDRSIGVLVTPPEVRSQKTESSQVSSITNGCHAEPPTTTTDEQKFSEAERQQARVRAEAKVAAHEARGGQISNRSAYLEAAIADELAHPTPPDDGYDTAVAQVLAGIRSNGRYGGRPDGLPPRADAAITAAGGWTAVCDAPDGPRFRAWFRPHWDAAATSAATA